MSALYPGPPILKVLNKGNTATRSNEVCMRV